MKYRVLVDISFDTEADARTIFNAAKALKLKAKRLTGEVSYIKLERCGHDSLPPTPCVEIDKVPLTNLKP